MDKVRIDKTFEIHQDTETNRKFIFPEEGDELSFAQTLALVHNGYTVIPKKVKDDITAMAIKKEMELTWSKGFTFTDKNGVETKVAPK